MAVEGGTSAETDQTRGAAHVVEHLWFQSHPGGGPRVWDRVAGLEVNGSTRADATTFTTIGAVTDLEALLALEGQRLTDPLQGVTEADVAAEREVVASELLMRGEHALRAANRYLDEALFPADHAYAHGTATIAQTRALGLDALTRYANAVYRPENVTLRIEGDVTEPVLEQHLKTSLPDFVWDRSKIAACQEAPAVAAVPPPTVASPVRVLQAPVWDRLLYVGWSVPGGWTGDDTRARMAADVLGVVVWSRVQWTRGIGADEAAGAACEFDPGMLASRILCLVALPPGADPESALKTVRGGLASLWDADDAATIHTLAATTPALLRDAFHAMESLDPDAIDRRTLHAHYRGTVSDPVQELLASIGTDLRPYFKKWITPDRMAAVVLEPSTADLAAAGHPAKMRLDTRATPQWTAPRARFDQVRTSALANGLPVWTVPVQTVPAVRTALVFEGGWATAPDGGANDILDGVMAFRFPPGFWEARLELAGTIELRYDSASDHQSVSGLAGNTPNWMWAHRVLLETAVLDESERQSELDSGVEEVFDDLVRFPWVIGRDLRRDHLFGSNRAALAWWERRKAARTTPMAQARAWRDAVFRPDNGVLVIVGGQKPEVAIGDAGRYLGDWTVGAAKLVPAVSTPPAPPSRATFVLPYDTTVAQVDASCRVPAWSPATAAALAVLESTLDRAWWQALREDAGSYGPAVSQVDNVHRSLAVLDISIVVVPADAAATAKVVTDTLDAVAAGAPESLVAYGRADAAARWARRSANSQGLFDALLFAADSGMTPADLTAMTAAIPKITAADLARLLKDCAGHEAVTIIGPKEVTGGETVDWQARGREVIQTLQ
jgi:predicted Zn-dependent peptidase